MPNSVGGNAQNQTQGLLYSKPPGRRVREETRHNLIASLGLLLCHQSLMLAVSLFVIFTEPSHSASALLPFPGACWVTGVVTSSVTGKQGASPVTGKSNPMLGGGWSGLARRTSLHPAVAAGWGTGMAKIEGGAYGGWKLRLPGTLWVTVWPSPTSCGKLLNILPDFAIPSKSIASAVSLG